MSMTAARSGDDSAIPCSGTVRLRRWASPLGPSARPPPQMSSCAGRCSGRCSRASCSENTPTPAPNSTCAPRRSCEGTLPGICRWRVGQERLPKGGLAVAFGDPPHAPFRRHVGASRGGTWDDRLTNPCQHFAAISGFNALRERPETFMPGWWCTQSRENLCAHPVFPDPREKQGKKSCCQEGHLPGSGSDRDRQERKFFATPATEKSRRYGGLIFHCHSRQSALSKCSVRLDGRLLSWKTV